MSKTLIEQLRDIVEESRIGGAFPTWYAAGLICNLRYNSGLEYEQELFTAIADRIEREYMPLPMLEGEPLNVGDKVDGYNQVGAEVVAIMNSEMIVVRSTVKGGNGYHDEAYPLLLWDVRELKRNQHDTLERIEADAMKMYNDYWGCGNAECHCCPVEVDGKRPCERYGDDVNCLAAQKLDLLRRQRELLERGQR